MTSPTTQIQGKSIYFRNHLKEQYLEYNQLFIDIRLTLISYIGSDGEFGALVLGYVHHKA